MQEIIQHFQMDMVSGIADGPSSPATDNQLATLKRIVKRARERLRLRHRLIRDGFTICHAHAEIVDALIEHLFSTVTPASAQKAAVAVVALGGYGRFELSPGSDIDVMFLYRRKADMRMAEAVVDRVLYALWDLGFTVGHCVRNIQECVAFARQDLFIRTGLIDARFLVGDKPLFDAFMEYFYRKCVKVGRPAFLEDLLEKQEQRRDKFGVSACLQEPNIKEGAGGLRDLQTVRWSINAKTPEGRTAIWKQIMDAAPAVSQAYHALLRIRNELHFLTQRRTDVLGLDLQTRIAQHLHYHDSRTLLASESLMRDYYRHARTIREFNEIHMARILRPKKSRIWRSRPSTRLDIFDIRQNTLTTGDEGIRKFEEDPLLILRAFDYAQAAMLVFDTALQSAIRKSLPAVGAGLRRDVRAAEVFKILLYRRGRVGVTLRRMHETGFLGKYLPAFERITFLVQHDLYHRYTIDEHTLIAVEILDHLVEDAIPLRMPYRDVFESIIDVSVLYLGVLLHDIGKGRGGGHVAQGMRIARRAGRQLNLNRDDLTTVLFLIEHHLLMGQISQRRDIDDEEVIQAFADTVGTVERLNMLLLLTYADLSAVGPDVFTEWKSALLLHLYGNTRRFLERGRHQPEGEALTAAVLASAQNETQRDVCLRHLKLLPNRYLATNAPAHIVEHALAAERVAQDALVALWSQTHNTGMTELTVCAMDRHGLFALITGVLAAHGVNVLGAQINTRTDHVAIDTFQICQTDGNPLFDPHWREQIGRDLERVILQDFPLSHLFRSVRPRGAVRRFRKTDHREPSNVEVTFDMTSSQSATIMEVRTADQPGLIYHLARTLSDAGFEIRFARIATIKNDVLDVFYVTEHTGAKLTDTACDVLKDRITRGMREVGMGRRDGAGSHPTSDA